MPVLPPTDESICDSNVRRRLNDRQAAQVNRRREAGEIADDAPTKRHDCVVSFEGCFRSGT
jgi:hypothetical protein